MRGFLNTQKSVQKCVYKVIEMCYSWKHERRVKSMAEKVRADRKKKGRPALFTEKQVDKIVSAYNAGLTQMDLAVKYKCSLSTIRRVLKERSE